jgi:hypothetical protein
VVLAASAEGVAIAPVEEMTRHYANLLGSTYTWWVLAECGIVGGCGLCRGLWLIHTRRLEVHIILLQGPEA